MAELRFQVWFGSSAGIGRDRNIELPGESGRSLPDPPGSADTLERPSTKGCAAESSTASSASRHPGLVPRDEYSAQRR